MMPPVDLSDECTPYLRRCRLLHPGEQPAYRLLTGGVSCRTVLVQRREGPDFVVKEALARLNVREDWFADPARIHVEAAALRVLPHMTPPGSVPRLLFEDRDRHLIAMEAVPVPHDNWKALLLAGRLQPDHVDQFARILAGIHGASFENEQYQRLFSDRRFFESLRLEPYYLFTARQAPAAAAFLHELVDETRAARLSLVHADYSPKNILVHAGRLVLLDHEVFHFGDGAFDAGFALTHLLSKAGHVPGRRADFLAAARRFWEVYADRFPTAAQWEPRVVRHTIACMLARVKGKSPLEYLTEDERRRQQDWCLARLASLPATIGQLLEII